MNLEGKSILITGASSGIGCELAKQLTKIDCKLFLIARRKNLLEDLVSELKNINTNIFIYECNVADKNSVSETYKQIRNETDFIDIAILNAGTGHNMSVEDYDSQYAEQIFGVNVFGIIYWIEQLLPSYLERGKGVIAGVSSLADNRGYSESGFYCASKAAVTIYLEGLRTELNRHNIKVITIKPGFVKTPMTDKNDFSMPLIMPVNKAAKKIIKGIKKEKELIQFPFPIVLGSKFVGALPTAIYNKLAHLKK